MKFLNRCNGYQLGVKMSAESRAKLAEILPGAREAFQEYVGDDTGPGGNYEFGHRFLDDVCVEERIATAAGAGEFMADPMAWALDGLRDCAGADHWYTYEKKWD